MGNHANPVENFCITSRNILSSTADKSWEEMRLQMLGRNNIVNEISEMGSARFVNNRITIIIRYSANFKVEDSSTGGVGVVTVVIVNIMVRDEVDDHDDCDLTE